MKRYFILVLIIFIQNKKCFIQNFEQVIKKIKLFNYYIFNKRFIYKKLSAFK
jgi:hypothetical protein